MTRRGRTRTRKHTARASLVEAYVEKAKRLENNSLELG